MSDALLANGVNNINGISSPESVAVDSPATPIDNSTTTDIKIDVEYTERESDVRHEPVAMKLDVKSDTPVEDASVLPQVGTPVDPGEVNIISSCARYLIVHQTPFPSSPRRVHHLPQMVSS